MPISKNADIRYRVLDTCFRDQNIKYTLDDLAKKCSERLNYVLDPLEPYSISTRQIRNDINFMMSSAGFEAPIVSIKFSGERPHYFTYEDPDFSISNKPLSEDDLANLKSSLFLLQRFGGTHQEDWIHDFALRIENLPVKNKAEQRQHHSSNDIPGIIVQYDHQDANGGGQWMVPLYQAIENKYPLAVSYLEFKSGENKQFRISPYLLKQYNRRWFVLCWSEGLPFVTTLPLDRIIAIESSTHEFKPYPGPGEQPAEFFEDIIGVTNDSRAEVEHVVLGVHKDLLPYLQSKVLHESQGIKAKATEDPDWFMLDIHVKPNYELYAVLLSHGPKLKVIEPPSLKEKMKELIHAMMLHY